MSGPEEGRPGKDHPLSVELWTAINSYAAACAMKPAINDARREAVLAVELALDKWWHAARLHPDREGTLAAVCVGCGAAMNHRGLCAECSCEQDVE